MVGPSANLRDAERNPCDRPRRVTRDVGCIRLGSERVRWGEIRRGDSCYYRRQQDCKRFTIRFERIDFARHVAPPEPHTCEGRHRTRLAQRVDGRAALRWPPRNTLRLFFAFRPTRAGPRRYGDDRRSHRKNASNPASIEPAISVHQSPMSNPSRRPSVETRTRMASSFSSPVLACMLGIAGAK
jgi:hypothetical protein